MSDNEEFKGYTPNWDTSLDARINWLRGECDVTKILYLKAKENYEHWESKLKEALAKRALQESIDRRDGGMTEAEFLGNE